MRARREERTRPGPSTQPATALRDALNADARTRVGNQLTAVEIDEKDHAGRAELVTLRGTRTVTVRGDVLREVMTRAFGVKSLRSTLFSVERNHDTLVFNGRGFGHGVGLCQAGALARLQAGQSPDSVLSHYFPGTHDLHSRGEIEPGAPLTSSRRHRVDDDVDGELGVVLALEALVAPVVVPLAAVVLVAVENPDPPAMLDRAEVVVDDVVSPTVQFVRGGRRPFRKRKNAR